MQRVLLDPDMLGIVFPNVVTVRLGECLDVGDQFQLRILRESSMKWVVVPLETAEMTGGQFQREVERFQKYVTLYTSSKVTDSWKKIL